eukprot:TRINITY_DN3297_c0_g2_i1.p1 TRINITY_DN3297_c0_g2~~TRINITY_DN3297_c0_g2_i1.p1  ORF type:complete len:714 (-),score=178.34 TRINITY_DN3297_c0_g2_i1:102-2243(-)
MFQDWLDNTEYDVIILGTGFEESLLAGALSRAGRKVLHLDANEYYGGNTATFPLNTLEKVLQNEPISNFSSISSKSEDSENKNNQKAIDIPNTTPLNLSNTAPPLFKNVFISWSINSHKVETTKRPVVPAPIEKEEEGKGKGKENQTDNANEPQPSSSEQSTTQSDSSTKQESEETTHTQNTITTETNTSASEPQHESTPKSEEEQSVPKEANTNTSEANTPTTSTQTTPQIDTKTKFEEEIQTLCKQARFYNADLNPRLLFSIGKMVSTLITSSVGRYLEFKSIDKTYLYIGGEIQPVPSNKGDVFKSKAISLLERRSLMKFMQLIQEGQSSNESYTSFLQFVQSQGLSHTLQSFVLYAIALAVADQSLAQGEDLLPYSEGIDTIKTYLGSLLKYGVTPFISSIYGTSEIPQAFCRLSAVYGGLYILRRSAQSLLIDKESQSVKGIICTQGQTLACKYFVSGPTYLSSLLNSDNNNNNNESSKGDVASARLICVTDKSIVNSEGLIFLVVPPQTPHINNLHAIHIVQTDSSLATTPDGKYLLHFTTIAAPNSREILESTAKNFVTLNAGESHSSEESSSSSTTKPQVIWYTYFEMHTKQVTGKENLPKNLILCGEDIVGPFVDFKKQIDNVKTLFHQICPDDEFLQKVPDPEDVVWVTEGEGAEGGDVEKKEGGEEGQKKEEGGEKVEGVEKKEEEVPKEQEPHATETSQEQ